MCKVEDAQLFASRPGYRVWKASINGSVLNTFMFKELLASDHPSIELLDFEITEIIPVQNGNHFGPIKLFRGEELVTWNEKCLFVINPENLKVLGSQKNIGFIKSVAVTETEIFVLRNGTDRHLVRIAEKPIVVPTHISKYRNVANFQPNKPNY